MTPEEPAAVLARFAAGVDYGRLPPAAVAAAKRAILDTLAIAVAGCTQGNGHAALAALVRRAGGAPEATVLGFGDRVPAWSAALVNGALARAVDFDDGHDATTTHPSSVVVPAALAAAERRGGVSGRELIAAVAVGDEILVRLALAIARRPEGLRMDGWFPSSVFGAFGGTAACARLLGAGADGVRSALGIALFGASGTLEAFSGTGQASMMRGMITGFTAQSCVMAAAMAAGGIAGVPDSLGGRFGLYRAFFGDSWDCAALFDGLGEAWTIAELGSKPWPTCRHTHSYIDATLQLVEGHDLAPDAIASIRIHVAGFAESRCRPLERQRRPENFNHAGHALPYLVAAAACRRQVTIDDLARRRDDPAVHALADRVIPVHDPRFSLEDRIGPSRVEIALADGRRMSRELEVAYGDWRNPMSADRMAAKFRDCLAYAPRPPAAAAVDELLDRLGGLEREPDLSPILALLS